MIYCANQWTGFYMVGTSVVKELSYLLPVQIYAINLNPIFSDTTLQYLQKAFTTF